MCMKLKGTRSPFGVENEARPRITKVSLVRMAIRSQAAGCTRAVVDMKRRQSESNERRLRCLRIKQQLPSNWANRNSTLQESLMHHANWFIKRILTQTFTFSGLVRAD